jgi:hypothetical protein
VKVMPCKPGRASVIGAASCRHGGGAKRKSSARLRRLPELLRGIDQICGGWKGESVVGSTHGELLILAHRPAATAPLTFTLRRWSLIG